MMDIGSNKMKYKELRKQVMELQNKLNIANNTVAKQIEENNRLNNVCDANIDNFNESIDRLSKSYESQLKVQDKELSRRLTIINYLEDRLFNRGE